MEEGKSRMIAFNVSSHGFMEMDGCSDVLGPYGEPAGCPR
jgi:predicted alternative tryptophan synthase beta-subunit